MVNEKIFIPKENYKQVEEVREIEDEFLSFEEFMKTYQEDEEVNDSYKNEVASYGDISMSKGYGPCSRCRNNGLTFKLEIVLENSRGGWAKRTVYNVDDACKAASEIVREVGFWSDGNPSFSSRERKSLVDKISDAISDHIVDNMNVDRTVRNYIDEPDCSIL